VEQLEPEAKGARYRGCGFVLGSEGMVKLVVGVNMPDRRAQVVEWDTGALAAGSKAGAGEWRRLRSAGVTDKCLMTALCVFEEAGEKSYWVGVGDSSGSVTALRPRPDRMGYEIFCRAKPHELGVSCVTFAPRGRGKVARPLMLISGGPDSMACATVLRKQEQSNRYWLLVLISLLVLGVAMGVVYAVPHTREVFSPTGP